MTYEIEVKHTADSGSGISVEAEVNGVAVAHTFPKGVGFFEEPENGKPAYVEKLVEKYEEKLKSEGLVAQSELSEEERKIHNSKFENKTYSSGQEETFKDDNKQENTMSNVELDDTEAIRKYLKENMAEGYLSEEEGLNIDRFVDRYEELLNTRQNFQEIIRDVQEARVQ